MLLVFAYPFVYIFEMIVGILISILCKCRLNHTPIVVFISSQSINVFSFYYQCSSILRIFLSPFFLSRFLKTFFGCGRFAPFLMSTAVDDNAFCTRNKYRNPIQGVITTKMIFVCIKKLIIMILNIAVSIIQHTAYRMFFTDHNN